MQPNVLYTYSSGVCPAAAPLWLRICWSWHLSASASWRNKCNHARCRRPVEKLSLSLSHSDSFRPSLCNSFHSAIRFLSRCKALVAEHWKETDRQPKAISRRLFLFYFSKGERERLLRWALTTRSDVCDPAVGPASQVHLALRPDLVASVLHQFPSGTYQSIVDPDENRRGLLVAHLTVFVSCVYIIWVRDVRAQAAGNWSPSCRGCRYDRAIKVCFALVISTFSLSWLQ